MCFRWELFGEFSPELLPPGDNLALQCRTVSLLYSARLTPRHTWSISSMQWVSTFASGASSLGRARRLAVHPEDSGTTKLPGGNSARTPLIYIRNIQKGKSEKKSLGQSHSTK